MWSYKGYVTNAKGKHYRRPDVKPQLSVCSSISVCLPCAAAAKHNKQAYIMNAYQLLDRALHNKICLYALLGAELIIWVHNILTGI